jgi:hypothetical protein
MRAPQSDDLHESSSQNEDRLHAVSEAPSCTALLARSLLFSASTHLGPAAWDIRPRLIFAEQLGALDPFSKDGIRYLERQMIFMSGCAVGILA